MRDAAVEARASWDDLTHELDDWGAAGRTATFWWRDDDAVRDGPELRRLFEVAGGVEVAIAAVPAATEASLAAAVSATHALVLQHGFAHANHAPPGERRSELGPHRPQPRIGDELAAGRARLARLFGERFLPVLVPPWNRIAPAVAAALPGWGFAGLSAWRARPQPRTLPQVNAHIDPVDWRGMRGFVGAAPALYAAVEHLRARRLGHADPAEPTGLLTHHRVMDAAGWAFVARFARHIGEHGAGRWIGIRQALTEA